MSPVVVQKRAVADSFTCSAADVRDIAVIDDPSQGPQAPASLPHDPAIVSQGVSSFP